jgi:hypothetical protein
MLICVRIIDWDKRVITPNKILPYANPVKRYKYGAGFKLKQSLCPNEWGAFGKYRPAPVISVLN